MSAFQMIVYVLLTLSGAVTTATLVALANQYLEQTKHVMLDKTRLVLMLLCANLLTWAVLISACIIWIWLQK